MTASMIEDIAKYRGKTQVDLRPYTSKIGGGKASTNFRKNEIVYSQGDPADSVFFIRQGRVKVVVLSEQGKEAVIALFGPGDFFGEGCLAGQELRQATVSIMTESVIVRIEKAYIVRLIRDEPAFAESFMTYLLVRKTRVEEDLVDHLFNSSEKRLARILLLLANRDKEGRPELIPVKISQEMLAEMIGTTRSRVSFFMNKFRELGFIDYKGHIEVRRTLLSAVLNDKLENQKHKGANMQHINDRASQSVI
jgi:CRP/FNR family cyclic AMP-dependent transcriptional regulator